MSDSLKNIILQLSESQPDIQSVFLFNVDGVILAGSHENSLEDTHIDEIGAASAAIKNIAERSSLLLHRGEMLQVNILSKQGSMIITGIGEDMILVALTQEQANIGMILHEIKSTSQKISTLL